MTKMPAIDSYEGKIAPASIAFDIDGVVADFMALFINFARVTYHVDWIKYKDITSYDLFECLDMDAEIIADMLERLLSGDYDLALPAIAGAPDGLGRLGAKHPVLMVTARSDTDTIGPWMEALLKPYNLKFEIIPTGNFDAKIQVLLDRNIRHFVEDRLETCFSLHQAGITPIVFRQPWNRSPHPFIEVTTWAELMKLIDLS